jgi:hypothetical protein
MLLPSGAYSVDTESVVKQPRTSLLRMKLIACVIIWLLCFVKVFQSWGGLYFESLLIIWNVYTFRFYENSFIKALLFSRRIRFLQQTIPLFKVGSGATASGDIRRNVELDCSVSARTPRAESACSSGGFQDSTVNQTTKCSSCCVSGVH